MAFIETTRLPDTAWAEWWLMAGGTRSQYLEKINLDERIKSLQAVDDSRMAARITKEVEEVNRAVPASKRILPVVEINKEKAGRLAEIREATDRLAALPDTIELVAKQRTTVPVELSIAKPGDPGIAVRLASFAPPPNPRGTWEIHSCAASVLQFDTPSKNMEPGYVCDDPVSGCVYWRDEEDILQTEKKENVILSRDQVSKSVTAIRRRSVP